jgi:hypothetical protein
VAFGVIRAVKSLKAAGTIADRGPVSHPDVTTVAVHERPLVGPQPKWCIAHCGSFMSAAGSATVPMCSSPAAHILHTLASEGELIET